MTFAGYDFRVKSDIAQIITFNLPTRLVTIPFTGN